MTAFAPVASTPVAAHPDDGLAAALNATLADLAIVSAGAVSIDGALTATLGSVTLSAASALSLKATSSITLDAATLAATGILPLTGAVSATLASLTTSAAGAISIKGALAVTLDDLIQDLHGGPEQSITDTEVLQLPIDYVLAGQQHMPTGRGLTFEPGRGTASERVRVGAGARGRLKGPPPSFTVRTDSRGYN